MRRWYLTLQRLRRILLRVRRPFPPRVIDATEVESDYRAAVLRRHRGGVG